MKIDYGDLSGPEKTEYIRSPYCWSEQSWSRGWRQGAMFGTLVTTLLLGGAIAFVAWAEWLGKCA